MKFGRLLTWTELLAPATGFESPVRLCLVKLDEGTTVISFFESEVASGDTVAVRVRGDKLVATRAAKDLAN